MSEDVTPNGSEQESGQVDFFQGVKRLSCTVATQNVINFTNVID